jgi:hypothetical protein
LRIRIRIRLRLTVQLIVLAQLLRKLPLATQNPNLAGLSLRALGSWWLKKLPDSITASGSDIIKGNKMPDQFCTKEYP